MLYLLTILLGNFDHSLFKSIYIFLISFFSNTFSAISGGGAGLLQLPALILSGVPYYQALASHKLATVALGIGGSLRNYKSLGNDISVAWQILIFGLPGVILGTSVVEYISEKYLYLILGIISILLAFYSFFKPDLGLSSGNKELNFVNKIRFFIFIFLIGILNGSISSGTGLLVTILLIKTFEMDFLLLRLLIHNSPAHPNDQLHGEILRVVGAFQACNAKYLPDENVLPNRLQGHKLSSFQVRSEDYQIVL